MPEGDSIARLAARVRGEVVGQTVSLCRLNVPRFATVDLTGQTLDAVVPRGKHLLMRFSAGLTLHSHLRMSGRWAIGTTKRPAAGGAVAPGPGAARPRGWSHAVGGAPADRRGGADR